jgi:hypothetical protein
VVRYIRPPSRKFYQCFSLDHHPYFLKRFCEHVLQCGRREEDPHVAHQRDSKKMKQALALFQGTALSSRHYSAWRNLLFFEDTETRDKRELPVDVKAHWDLTVEEICEYLSAKSSGMKTIPWNRLLFHPRAPFSLRQIPKLSKDPNYFRDVVCGAIKRCFPNHHLLGLEAGKLNSHQLQSELEKYSLSEIDLQSLCLHYRWQLAQQA